MTPPPSGSEVRVRVCFVCLGNICRSPTAEGILREQVLAAGLAAHVEIDSAGTAAYHVGDPPDPRSAETARQRGVILTSRGRQFERRDFDRFDYVVALDRANRDDLVGLARSRAHAEKVVCLREFDPSGSDDLDVPDPYYGEGDGFERVFEICRESCRGLLAHLIEDRELR